MRTSTLVLADLALSHGGVRPAARAAGLPVSTISAALSRFEEGLSMTLVRRSQTGLVPTVDAARRAPAIGRMADIARSLHRIGRLEVPGRPATLAALFRLAEVARMGSIRRAAATMGMSQPQLTRQIAQLEENHGAALMSRQSRGVTPTPEGLRVLELVGRLESEWRAFSGEAEPVYAPLSRRFSLGSIISATARGELAQIVGAIATRLYMQQGITFTLSSAIAEDLLKSLDAGRFDVVLIDTDLRDPAYRQHQIARSPVALIGEGLPRDFADPRLLTRALSRRPLLLPSRCNGLRQRAELFLDQFAEPDWRRQVPVIEIDSLPVIVNMVMGGQFRSLLPKHVETGIGTDMVVALPPEFDQRLQLTWKRLPKSERFAHAILAGMGQPAQV